jgi:hypothetical protein
MVAREKLPFKGIVGAMAIESEIHIKVVRCIQAAENARCNPSAAKKNVSVANNGSNLIRAVTHANIFVPKFCAKDGGKQPLKDAGWPNIRIIGVGQNGSKTLNYGAWIILIGRRRQYNGAQMAE